MNAQPLKVFAPLRPTRMQEPRQRTARQRLSPQILPSLQAKNQSFQIKQPMPKSLRISTIVRSDLLLKSFLPQRKKFRISTPVLNFSDAPMKRTRDVTKQQERT